jgi:hypothetical protein
MGEVMVVMPDKNPGQDRSHELRSRDVAVGENLTEGDGVACAEGTGDDETDRVVNNSASVDENASEPVRLL